MSKFKVHSESGNGFSPPSYYKEGNPALIDIHSEESLEKWGKILDLSKKELIEAVEVFGPEVRNIRRGLRQNNEVA